MQHRQLKKQVFKEKVFNPLCRKLFLAIGILCFATTVKAQYTIYHGSSLGYSDKIYPSVTTIFNTDPATNGAGYAIATTSFDPVAPIATQGEIIRTNATGVPLWTRRFNVGGNRYRFTHIESYKYNNAIEHLVVGSRIDPSGVNYMLVARISDGGNVLRSVYIRPVRLTHLLGIKGIYASDGSFAIVASECGGFDARASKYSVVLKLDINLNVQKYHTYNTPNIDDDYDFPTGITEGATADEYLIVGTSNKDVVPMIVNSQAAAMSTLIRMTTGAVTWSYNYSTSAGIGWDAAADGYFNPADSTFWVLGNDPYIHSFNLTRLNRLTGTVMNKVHFYDNPFGQDLNNYGFELKPSLSGVNQFVIGGWKINGYSVMPFMADVNPYTRTVKWQQRYSQNNNQLVKNVENPLLRIDNLGYFPVFYDNIMAYNTTKNGYVILGSDSLNAPNIEAPQLWNNINLKLENSCGPYKPILDSVSRLTFLSAPLSYLSGSMSSVSQAMSPIILNYQTIKCSIAPIAGQFSTTKTLPSGEKLYLYPNPASDAWTLESSVRLKQLRIYDVYGHEVLYMPMEGVTKQTIDIRHLRTGMYILKIIDEQQQVSTIKAQVVK